jgi:putative Holliday junction resolvase
VYVARALGLDVGTKTIGMALSDPLKMLASPVSTLARKGVRRDVEAMVAAFDGQVIDTVVVGLPLELDGTETRSARLARQIGEATAEATGWRLVYVDERFTSVDAERQLIAAGASRDRRKQIIDQQAAVIILQSWLDHPELEHGDDDGE